MEQKDYVLREIEKIGTILNAIRQKIFGGKYNPAITLEMQIENITNMLSDGMNFDLDYFLGINIEDSKEYIALFKGFSVENIELFADCLFQIGSKEQGNDSKKYLEKALHLYELCNLKGKTYSFVREENIKTIKNIMKLVLVIISFLCSFQLIAQPLERIRPEQAGIDAQHLRYADEVILQAIADNDIPGAVLAIVYKDKMAYLKAYGNKQTYPSVLPMDVNTVFDMASVSKSMSTAVSAMILVERGKLRLIDRVNLYIPGFQGNIRIIDLLTHTSGLPPYAPVDSLEKLYGAPNPDGLIKYITSCKRDFEVGKDFQYSCLNYITLQRIIETVSGMSLKEFAQANIFDVLGMNHTTYQPEGETLKRAAPTEKQPDGSVLHGIVHDPLARVMNDGISGNAGVFSDADDLAMLAVALMNGGIYNGKRILSPQGVRVMTTVPESLKQFGRSPGWDLYSDYASNKGDLFNANTYGHTGYTGTSIIIDPDNGIAVILLANRVHPSDDGNVVRLRSLVANVVAAAFGR